MMIAGYARAAWVALAGLVLVLAPAVTASAPAATASPPAALADDSCVDGWTTVGLPASLDGLEPHAVAAIDGQPAWIVGLPLPRADPRVMMIGRWSNGGWVKVPAPWKSYGVLNAIQATSADNAWMVGAKGIYVRWPIAAQWNGTSWARLVVPRPKGQWAVFTDLAALDSRRFWAVGARLQTSKMKPVAMLHRPKGWRTLSPHVPAGAQAGLTAAAVDPSGRVWAGGWRTDDTGQGRPWVVYRTSSGKWHTTPLAAVPAGRASILDLAFASPTDGWAAGFVEGAHGYVPILQHWNGTRWSNVALPWAAGQSLVLETVTVDAAGALVVGGMRVDAQVRDVLAVLNGGSWQVTSLSTGSAAQMSAIMSAASLGSGAVAVGFVDGHGVTLLPCSGGASGGPAVGGPLGVPDPAAQDGAGGGTVDEIDDDVPATPDVPDTFVADTVPIANTVAIDVTDGAGLDIPELSSLTWGGVVGDFNGDGYDDIYMNRHYLDVPVLMLNSASGVFSRLVGDFTVRDRHGCDAADVDLNGQLDLFCAVGVNKGTSNKPDELTLNVGDGGGTWASTQFGLIDGFGRARDVHFLNLGGDPYPDVYVVNEPNRSDGLWSSNRLYQNVDGTGFVSAPSWGVDLSIGYGCVNAADLNGDGKDELLVCTTEPTDAAEEAAASSPTAAVHSAATMPAGARIYYNENGHFVDRTAQLGILIGGVSQMLVADFNGDGTPDLAELSKQLLSVSLQSGGTFHQAYQLDVTDGVSMAVGDVNGDGLPDIYVARHVAGNSGNLMLVNDGDGSSFSQMAIPQPGSGSADEVLAIDYDHNGRTDFVTVNGWSKPGPLNLTAFYPAP